MKMMRSGWIALAILCVLGIGSVRWGASAQEPSPLQTSSPDERKVESGPTAARAVSSVQDALYRPCTFPFGADTSLDQVVEHLHRKLNAPVVLDPAALKRQEITEATTVRLSLDGVRLATGLKLLLEQVGLTYRVVPEDNLLILTDNEGATEPSEQVLAELKALHRDVHQLQDALNQLVDMLAPEEKDGPAMRTPTIIEELPQGSKDKPVLPPARTRPG